MNGIKTTGKIAYFTVLSPYVLLTILLIRVLMLDGSYSGIKYMFKPDFSKLFDVKIWTDAATQAFFQFGSGQGLAITLNSFRKIGSSVVFSSRMLVILNTLNGLFCSIIVFGFLGYYSQNFDIPIDELPLQGADLLYVAYPAIFTSMPFQNLWSILFFCVVVLFGVDSQFGYIEVLSYFIDDLGLNVFGLEIRKWKATMLICVILW